jgi:hypothetical protein
MSINTILFIGIIILIMIWAHVRYKKERRKKQNQYSRDSRELEKSWESFKEKLI